VPTQTELTRLRVLIHEIDRHLGQLDQVVTQVTTQPSLQAQTEVQHLLEPIQQSLQELETRIKRHEKEREHLHALQAVGAAINSSLELQQVLQEVMDAIIALTGAERAFLMLMNDASGAFEVQIARNMDRETIDEPSFDVSRSVMQSVVESGQPVVTINAQSDPRFSGSDSVISYNLRSILCVPLKVRAIITGVIYADNRIASGIFNDSDRDLLANFANQAAVAIENARLFQQIRDQLTHITEMKNLMDDVFASIASGVITIDAADTISLFNHAAERILGLTAKQVVEQPYRRALAAVAGIDAMVEKVKQEGGQYNREVDTAVARSSSVSTLNMTFSPLRGEQQGPFGVVVVLDDISEKKRVESLRRYLPPALVDQVRGLEVAQRPQRRRMSVMFADVRGFTTLSERMEPEKLIQVINGYFAVAATAISQYEGVIDKYMGDAIMAEFNTTLNPQVNHVERAVRTALMIQEELAAYHAVLPPERRLYFGIGLHVGEAVAGNVGTHFRKDYSVIGDAVNTAKRLQEFSGPNQIVISQAVYDSVKSWVEVNPLGPQQLKNRQEPIVIYELLGEKPR
jgi:PAS domain S-box-containing protein